MEKRIVAVFGGYRHKPGDGLYEAAEELGRRIAQQGWVLLNGGYGGTMEASARGAKAVGGRTVGVTCGLFSAQANPFMDRTVHTGDLYERIRIMLDRADAFVALPGATGTLAEVAMAWEFLAKGFMRPKPMALLGDFWRPLYDMLVPRPGVKAEADGLVRVVDTPKAAVDTLRPFLTK